MIDVAHTGKGLDIPEGAVRIGVDYGKEPFNVVFFDESNGVIERFTIEKPEAVERPKSKPMIADPIPENALPTMDEAMELARGSDGGPKYEVHGLPRELTPDMADEAHYAVRSESLLERTRKAAKKYGPESRAAKSLPHIEKMMEHRYLPPSRYNEEAGKIRDSLVENGWREGRDNLWRHDAIGGSYLWYNAIKQMPRIEAMREKAKGHTQYGTATDVSQPQSEPAWEQIQRAVKRTMKEYGLGGLSFARGGHVKPQGDDDKVPAMLERETIITPGQMKSLTLRDQYVKVAILNAQRRQIEEKIWQTAAGNVARLDELGRELFDTLNETREACDLILKMRRSR